MEKISVKISNEIRIAKSDLPEALFNLFIGRLIYQNPLYGRNKRFGRSIENVPETISAIRVEGDDVVIARGYMGEVVRLFYANRLAPEIEYLQPCVHENLIAPFQCTLDWNAEAAGVMDAKRFGVLEGPPGSGRRNTAIKLISRRAVKTLIVVSSRPVMHLWKSLLEKVLPPESIGLIGDGNMETGRDITVAVNKSLFKLQADGADLTTGFIILDQCEKISWTTIFKISRINCLYVLGISTGPRTDGLTKLMEAYVGPRLYRIEPKTTNNISFTVKSTGFEFEYSGDWMALVKAAVTDEQRNMQIVEDILQASASLGKCLFVSERSEQLEIIRDTIRHLNGPEVEILNSRVKDDEREKFIHRFNRGYMRAAGCVFGSIPLLEGVNGIRSLFMCSPVRYDDYLFKLLFTAMKGSSTSIIYEYRDQPMPLKRSLKKRIKIYRSVGMK